MKLDQDCVRDLLLAVEELSQVNKTASLEHYVENSNLKEKSYSEEELMYTASRLKEAGFIHSQPNGDFSYYFVSTLTYDGHVFLDTIRDPKVWAKTKEVTSRLASVSLPIVAEIGSKYLKNLLNLE